MGKRTAFAIAIGVLVMGSQVWAICVYENGKPLGPDCNTTTTTTTKKSSTLSSGGSTVPCPTPNLAISYCFNKNITATKCVRATSDSEAAKACGAGYSYWDLSKSQYGVSNAGNNVWMCSRAQTKQAICQSADPKYKLVWRPISATDGTCWQESNGTPDQCGFSDLAKDPGPPVACSEADNFLENANYTPTNGQSACICKTDYVLEGGKCNPNTKVTVEPPPAGVDPKLKECVESHEKISATCVNSSSDALKSCDSANKANSEVNELAGLPGQVAKQFEAAKVGTGMIKECLQAGVLANGSQLLMGQLKQTCDANNQKCNVTCGLDKADAFNRDCHAILLTVIPQISGVETDSIAQNVNVQYFNEHAKAVNDNVTKGTAVCTNEAKAKQSMLSDLLNGFGNALLGAQTCACQVAASAIGGAAGNCNSGSPAAVAAIDVCTMGSTNYSAQGCTCQTTPTAQGCAQYAANSSNAGFAGLDVGAGSTTSGAAFGTPGSASSGGSLDGIDLGQKTADDLAAVKKASDGGGGAGGVNPGGGAGGGGGSAPSPSAAEAAGGAGEGEAKGLGGVFGAMKSMMGNMFGAKPTPTSTSGAGGKFDPNAYKPKNGLRGVAGSGSGLGGKNADIFEIVNTGYDNVGTTFNP